MEGMRLEVWEKAAKVQREVGDLGKFFDSKDVPVSNVITLQGR